MPDDVLIDDATAGDICPTVSTGRSCYPAMACSASTAIQKTP